MDTFDTDSGPLDTILDTTNNETWYEDVWKHMNMYNCKKVLLRDTTDILFYEKTYYDSE